MTENHKFSTDKSTQLESRLLSNFTMNTQNSSDRFSSFEHPNKRNATYFLSDDVSGSYSADFRYLNKSRHFQQLKEINEGRCLGLNRENDHYHTRELSRWHIEALSSQLGLTIREKIQARRYFMSLDREELGLESNLVAHSVCAYVVEQNEKNDVRRSHPNVPDGKRDHLFQEMEENLELNHRDIVKTYGKLQNQLQDTTPPVREDFDENDDLPGGGGI